MGGIKMLIFQEHFTWKFLEVPGQGVFYEAGNSRGGGLIHKWKFQGRGVFLREVLNLPVRFKTAVSH